MSSTYIASLPSASSIGDNTLLVVETPSVATQKGLGSQILAYIEANIDAITSSMINANNGVAGLNNVGVIDVAQLPFGTTDYIGTYNTSTNTPTLSDGTGSGGQFLWVSTGGTINLGSGNITTSVGNLLVHNGSIWQVVPISSAGVVSVNGKTGVVLLTTTDIGEGANRRYVTDAQQSALAGSDGVPSSNNKYVTESGLALEIATSVTALFQTAIDLAQAAQTTADNAIPITQKGSVNGVATLDASGFIPSSQINFSPLSYVGTWNANTNSPTLADGSGAVGQAYYVTVAGTQNLGSGNQTFAIGSSVIYSASGVWQLANVSSGVTSVAGKVGAVSLDQNDIASVTNKRVVSDAMLAGLTGASGVLSATVNPLVSEQRLQAALTTANPAFASRIAFIQNYEVSGLQSGTGVSNTLANYGITSTQAATYFPRTFSKWGAITTDITYDACVLQEAVLASADIKGGFIQSADDRLYFVNHKTYFPSQKSVTSESLNSYMFGYDFRGTLIRDTRSGAEAIGGLLNKVPVSQTVANNFDVEYAFDIRNLRLYGTGITGSIGIEFGASKRSAFSNIDIRSYQLGTKFAMMLNCDVERINVFDCSFTGITFLQGWWTGATVATTVSQPRFRSLRINTSASGRTGLYVYNCDQVSGNDLQFEGAAGLYGLYYDTGNTSTVTKNAFFTNLRFESESKYDNALIGVKSRDGFTFGVDGLWHQAVTSGTYLIESEAYASTNPTITLSNMDNNGGATAWKINNINQGTCFAFNQVRLPTNPQTVSDITSSGTSIFDGTMPTTNRLTMIAPRMPKP